MKNILRKIDLNAPVILSLTGISLLLLLLRQIFGAGFGNFFAVYFSAWSDPLMYVRLLTHTLMHADWAHYTGNFMLLLAIGPMVEEKYGSRSTVVMIVVTSLVTGLIQVLFFRNVMLMGASGIVFMLILVASFVNIKEGKFPLTVVLVALFFIGNEVITAVTQQDQISQLSHILGGICGALFGYFLNKGALARSARNHE